MTTERAMLAKIEQMVAELLPIPDDHVGDPDIAHIVLRIRDCADKATVESFFKGRSGEEGWYEIAHLLANALITIDKEHRKIIKAIRGALEQS
jgi:hypothetical protein